MELALALTTIDLLIDCETMLINKQEKAAWKAIRAYIAEVQKPSHNNARVETVRVWKGDCDDCKRSVNVECTACRQCSVDTHSNFVPRTASPVA
jgi:hypothetical protein